MKIKDNNRIPKRLVEKYQKGNDKLICPHLFDLRAYCLVCLVTVLTIFLFKQDGERGKEDHESKPENEQAGKADGTTAE